MVWRSLGECLEAALLRMLNDGGRDLGPDPRKGQPAQLEKFIGGGEGPAEKEPGAREETPPAKFGGSIMKMRTGGVAGSKEPSPSPKARPVLNVVATTSRHRRTASHAAEGQAPVPAVRLCLLAVEDGAHGDVSLCATGLSSSAAAKLARSISG